ncbi:carboxylesterase family protein [Proteobacteria bacterium 005FR1]|nr:carboxylesterase family protein [Proteobacteria bacterium 005FR1]
MYRLLQSLGRSMQRASTIFLLGVSLAASAAYGDPAVRTPVGEITGVETDYGAAYLGVPFAQPPVGELRWKAPQAVTELASPYAATQTGASCPQLPSPFGSSSVNEDCLYLNIYQPSEARLARFFGGLPVMVWFHGGAFTSGSGAATDPARLAEEGVIVITVNYRLGALGFMAHPALTAEAGASGNYGLMDQQAALHWVQNNIASFGGNPDRVTIFGESAGGLSVHAHLASPESAGLFDRAIIQSGAYLLEQPGLFEWEFLGLSIAAKAGCPDQSLSCLRSLPVEQILANQDPGALGWLPIVDGAVLPQSVLGALQSGDFNKVPVVEGTTADEYTLFTALLFELQGKPVTAANYVQSITEIGFPAEVAPIIAAQYPVANYPSASEALSALGTDFLFACNSLTSMRLLSEHVPVYGYEFADPNAPMTSLPPVSFPFGAAHTTEIQYLMDVQNGLPPLLNAEQQTLAGHMVNYWSNFAKYSSPNGWGSPFWIRFGEQFELLMSLEPPTPELTSDFAARHQCDFWNLIAASGN